MRDIWFISDTHFDHANMLKFTDDKGYAFRGALFKDVKEMNETMIQNWNRVVKDGDIVYHLGDVTFKPNNLASIMSRLKGHKRLIVGNHDDVKNYELTKWFEKIMIWRLFKDEGIIFSHIPLRKDQFRYKVKFCGHGHIHQNMIDEPEYINLCVEHNDYTPVSMDKIKEIIKQRARSVPA